MTTWRSNSVLARADELFVAVAKDEFSLRSVETALSDRPVEVDNDDEISVSRPSRAVTGMGSVLVVGVDALMTQLAKCCKPAPPDAIVGFVTRGQGRLDPSVGLQQFYDAGANAIQSA